MPRLADAERRPYRNAVAVAAADPNERMEVTVLIRRGAAAADLKAHAERLSRPGHTERHLSRAAFSEAYGASPADIAVVRAFATTHGLKVVQVHAGRRTMILAGTVAQFSAAFDVELKHYEYDGGTYRGRTGDITLAPELAGIVEGVLGLDNRPAAQPHFRRYDAGVTAGSAAGTTAGGIVPGFSPTQVATLYNFPPGTGAGQCIALIELGGGYNPADLAAYFGEQGIAPAPTVVAVSVDQAVNAPTGNAEGPDGEVVLDIEIAGAVAPGARIAVYFAPNTDAGFLDAVTTAVHDTANTPNVLSISWGSPESDWTGQATTAFDSAFQAAAVMGITVLVASGDGGSTDNAPDGANHADFPASSPHATGCGGTRITANGGALAGQVVWNEQPDGGASGGGVSTVFATPAWQANAVVTTMDGATAPLAMRGVPDVAADADPQTGYLVRVDGADTVVGGTSAVAPLLAGLIARINANTGRRAGLLNPSLYANPNALRDVTSGNNGAFLAAPGWDACTGLGSPDGTALQQILTPPAS